MDNVFRRQLALAATAAAVWVLPATAVRADELAEKGRAIYQANQRAIVTVRLDLKNTISVPGSPARTVDSRQDASGAVVDPSGLTVLSLSATDPGELLQRMAGGGQNTKFKTELAGVKILLDDGTELAGDIVFRDKDLDLAFIRPRTKPAAPMAALDLGRVGKAEVLDPVIALNRLGNAGGRAYAASVERIAAVIQRPRLCYVPETSLTTTSLGAPAFTVDGKLLGLFVTRAAQPQDGAGPATPQASNLIGIILPAEDIANAVKQVAPAKP